MQDLKLFSKPDEERRDAVDLGRVLESSVRMAWNEIRHRARLVKDFSPVPPVAGNEARLGQVFLNLLVNAAQAIREGDATRNEIRVSTRVDPDGQVVTEVRDTGPGMPQEVLEQVFEPFFTTKPVGIGAGLGLSICRRIVHEFGGTIAVESTPGRGTTVRVTLPAAEVRAVELEPLAAPVPLPVRRGRILVIDDEPIIARVIVRSIGRNHDVTCASSGAEALELLGAGNAYDVVLCDMMMPEMSGMDLYEVLARTRPGDAERVIFLTGGAFTPSSREFLDRVPNQRLEKPFDPVHLRGVINDRIRAMSPATVE